MIAQVEQHMTSQLDKVQALTWTQELCAPPSFLLLKAYELQRDVLLKTLELERYSQLESSLFDLVWKVTKNQVKTTLPYSPITQGRRNFYVSLNKVFF
jgi:hypothetical protein